MTMEAILITFILCLPLLILANLVLSILLLSRQKKLRQRLEDLEAVEETAPDLQGLREIRERLRILEEGSRKVPPSPVAERGKTETPEHPLPPELQPTPVEEAPPAMETVQTPIRPPAPPSRPVFVPPAEQPHPTSWESPVPKSRGLHFNIEEWVGVRGAAAAGGIVLALAALLFFQYSIEHGLITPLMRVVAGVVTGLASLGASEYLINRRQQAAANALSGAGIVILYASTWAAENLYGLIGAIPAFVLMVVITSVCITLAMARSSSLIAILGLVGGFLTPLLISAPSTGPIALFGYLMLLDLALLWLARMKRWPLLAILCLVGTALHQLLWITDSMNSERAVLGLGILLIFGLLFLVVGPSRDEGQSDSLWRLTRAAGIAIPFIFGLHFAATARLEIGPLQLGIFLVVLSAGACFLAHRRMPSAAPAAAVASAGVMSLYFLNHQLDLMSAWKSVGVLIGIVLVYFPADLIGPDERKGAGWATVVVGLSSLGILLFLPAERAVSQPWPWVLGWLVSAGILIHLSRRKNFSFLHIPASMLPALGLAVAVSSHSSGTGALASQAWVILLLAGPLLLSIAAALSSDGILARRLNQATIACISALIPATASLTESFELRIVVLAFALTLVLNILGSVAATRLLSGPLYLLVVISGALSQSIVWDLGKGRHSIGNAPIEIMALLSLATIFFIVWPALSCEVFKTDRAAWWAAALTPFLYFPILRQAWIHAFGVEIIAILPIALAAICLGVFAVARNSLPEGSPGRRSSEIWYLAATLCLVALAIPLQLHREWITIGWALNAFGLVLLWKYLDHPGLKYLAFLLFSAVSIRLLINPAVLSYHQPGSLPLLNWLSYTYLIPAAALLGARRIMSPLEVARQRPRELSLPGGGMPFLANLYGLASIAIIFAWINLSIAEYFSTGHHIVLSLSRMPARDLSTSVAWALYAVVLLVLGVKSRSKSLRWISLSLMLITLSKVFLHDLGSLQDLYRVASLVGLALSLIVVSLIYQRFVFSTPKEKSE